MKGIVGIAVAALCCKGYMLPKITPLRARAGLCGVRDARRPSCSPPRIGAPGYPRRCGALSAKRNMACNEESNMDSFMEIQPRQTWKEWREFLTSRDSNPMWSMVFSSHLQYDATLSEPSNRFWFADSQSQPSWVVFAEYDDVQQRGKLRLYNLDLQREDKEETMHSEKDALMDKSSVVSTLLQQAMSRLQHCHTHGKSTASRMTKPLSTIMVSALDRRLVPVLSSAMGCWTKAWTTECSMYRKSKSKARVMDGRRCPLPSGYHLRSLTPSDAALVNSKWEYRSEGSLDMILQMIQEHPTECLCVAAATTSEVPVAWILRYLEGGVGMLWTEAEHRRKGLAEHLIHNISGSGQDDNGSSYCYIVDSNTASRRLFEKAGWERVGPADWVAYRIDRSK